MAFEKRKNSPTLTSLLNFTDEDLKANRQGALSQTQSMRLLISLLIQTVVCMTGIIFGGVILLAGLYPAFVQSAFRPAESLKSKAALSSGKLTLRKSLVIFQFAISQAMIIGTLVVAYQMDFFQTTWNALVWTHPTHTMPVVPRYRVLSNQPA